MKQQKLRVLVLAFALVLVAVLALGGCSKKNDSQTTVSQITFEAYDLEGNVTEMNIAVGKDAETVGDVLAAIGMIDGDDGPYGLYVKTVNGITLDYDKDKMYWAFYVDGEYAATGVDKTPIEEGVIYAFKPEQ